MVSRLVGHMLRPLRRRVAVMVNRAVVTLIDDARKMQAVQLRVLAGEVIDGVEHFQPFGLTAHPVKGAEAVVLAVGGHRAHSIVVVADDRRYRPRDLAEGETELYNAFGDYVHLKADGTIVVNAQNEVTVQAATKVTIDAASCEITGNVDVGGTLTAQGQIDSPAGVSTGGIELGTHVHGGVQSGPDTTGAPQ